MHLSKIVYNATDHNFFSLIIDGKKVFFYLQKNMAKKYGKYLDKGVKVVFNASDDLEIHHDVPSYLVTDFVMISKVLNNGKKVVYFDANIIKKGIKTVVNKNKNKMFIDFEMNMQEYHGIDGFVQEIVEAGFVLTDNSGAIRKYYHHYIKPVKFKKITKRTKDFLGYNDNTFDEAITFTDFYNDMKAINEKYHPDIYVWGKSDVSQYMKCEDISKLPHLNLNFINLLQLHINYFNLKTSPGLFNTWEKYYNKDLQKQAHSSIEDAEVTKDIFFKFRERVNKD